VKKWSGVLHKYGYMLVILGLIDIAVPLVATGCIVDKAV